MQRNSGSRNKDYLWMLISAWDDKETSWTCILFLYFWSSPSFVLCMSWKQKLGDDQTTEAQQHHWAYLISFLPPSQWIYKNKEYHVVCMLPTWIGHPFHSIRHVSAIVKCKSSQFLLEHNESPFSLSQNNICSSGGSEGLCGNRAEVAAENVAGGLCRSWHWFLHSTHVYEGLNQG